MKLHNRGNFRKWVLATCLLLGVVVVFPIAIQARQRMSPKDGHWVNTWVAMPQLTEPGNLPPEPFKRLPTANAPAAVFVDATLRQTIHTSIGGKQLRATFSNVFGTTPLNITSASVALPTNGAAGVSGIQPGTERPLTFQKKRSVTIRPGAQVVTDTVDYNLRPASNLTVSVYLASGQVAASIDITSDTSKVPVVNVTSHPGSRTTSYMAPGNHVSDTDIDTLPGAASTNHWYFLSGLEVWADKHAAAVVVLGDSLADGRGSTNNQNNRWPDQLLARLQSYPTTAQVAVLNQAAGGNAVLHGGLGPIAVSRLDRDVFAQSGVRWLVVFEGINDLGNTSATKEAQTQIASELIDAYDQIIRRAHTHNIVVYGGTLTPMKGHGYYDETGHREAARQTVNAWIRSSGRFDAVVDFDQAVRDPADPARIRDELQMVNTNSDGSTSLDGLHFSPAGYKVIADAVHATLFWHHGYGQTLWHFDDDSTSH